MAEPTGGRGDVQPELISKDTLNSATVIRLQKIYSTENSEVTFYSTSLQKHRSLIYIEIQFKNVLYISIFVARFKKNETLFRPRTGKKWSHLRALKFEWEHFESALLLFIILSPSTLEESEHTPMTSLHFDKLLFLTKTVHLNFAIHSSIVVLLATG